MMFATILQWRWESAVLGCCFLSFLLLTKYFVSIVLIALTLIFKPSVPSFEKVQSSKFVKESNILPFMSFTHLLLSKQLHNIIKTTTNNNNNQISDGKL